MPSPDATPPPHAVLELLAPAGNWECVRAAVANGADAVYFGLQRFNARLRADNFTESDLPDVMAFLHGHGVRGFVAMNTLVFTGELEAAAEQLRALETAAVDAIIVQDIGLVRLARQVAPRLEIHASTQMTLTSPEGLRFVDESLGLDRAVLARELSLRELRKFHAATAPAASQTGKPGREVPLEVFVHGALCVAYSGQCLTSEALGQRSANRGECAQACRLPYQLVVDGQPRDLGDQRYLLSPQDLAAVEEIPALIEIGVRSFKIEGRLKSPEYVAAVTRVYRKAIDQAMGVLTAAGPRAVAIPRDGGAGSGGSGGDSSRRSDGARPVTDPTRYQLEMAFSRGLSTGWMNGVNHQELVHAWYGKKRGAYLGTVTGSGPGWVDVDLIAPLAAGDGVVFENPADTDREMGGRVLRLEGRRLVFDRRASVDPARVVRGTRVFKTDDPRLNAELRATWAGDGGAPGRVPLRLVVAGAEGHPLRVTAAAEFPNGRRESVTLESAMPLRAARTRPLTEAVAREQVGRLGGTPYHLASLELKVTGNVILPLSELNRLRREIVQLMPRSWGAPASGGPVLDASREAESKTACDEPVATDPVLTVLCRSFEQIQAALACGVGVIYADFEDIRRGKEIVATVRAATARAGRAPVVLLATPRIQKAGEEGYFKLIERAEPDGVLVRNLGAIRYFAARPHFIRLGDFSLNVANPIAAEFFINRGLDRLTVSYDLNVAQVLDLMRAAPPAWFELTLHQHMPMFHMEHCVFAAFMSQGRDYTDCGRPCEKHRVELRDRVGQSHPLLADVGCRNTLFRGQAQTGARFYRDLRASGLARFRVELLRESAEEARAIITAYQRLLAGQDDGSQLWQQLHATSQLGVTEGTLLG
ncbi:MAG: DUF3656 domain-containing protein [Verrucomicrobiales bacterium]